MPAAPLLGGGEHPPAAAHVAKGSLAGPGGDSGDRKLDRLDIISIHGKVQVCRRYDQESTTVFSSEQVAIGEQAE